MAKKSFEKTFNKTATLLSRFYLDQKKRIFEQRDKALKELL
jgi:hypothetical protein